MYVPGVVRMFRNDLYTYTIPKACVSAYGTNVKEMSLFFVHFTFFKSGAIQICFKNEQKTDFIVVDTKKNDT